VADIPAPCPRADLHTPAPFGYLAWHEWAEVMSRTHRQRPCPGCDRVSIWEPTMPTCALPPVERACAAVQGLVI
jgi:hypothetical protein